MSKRELHKRLKRLRRRGQELWRLYHSFKLPDAPQRGEMDAAWAGLKAELDRDA